MSNYLLFISCSQRKLPTPAPLPAIDRYDGPVYRTIRKAIREDRFPQSIDIFIISAKYGLLLSDTPIADYDLKMTPDGADALRSDIQRALNVHLTFKRYDQVFINLGAVYRRTLEGFHWGLTPTLEATGGIGLRTAQVKAWIEKIS